MKLVLTFLLALSIQNTFASDSILGKKIESSDRVGLPSVIIRYSPSTFMLGSEYYGYGEKHDAHVIEIGIDGSYPIYSRLYFEGGLGGIITKVDDTLYGDGDATAYGFYSELGVVHKTFFGRKKSYDLALRIGLSSLLTDLELTDKNGDLDTVRDDDLSIFYIEPTIGINYNQFAILIGYKFITNIDFEKSMPTLALKYYF